MEQMLKKKKKKEEEAIEISKGYADSLITSICCCSVAKSGPTLCNPKFFTTPGFPVLHHLPEFAQIQTHVHWVNDAIQPSHPLSSPSPPAFNISQHQGLFQLTPPTASWGLLTLVSFTRTSPGYAKHQGPTGTLILLTKDPSFLSTNFLLSTVLCLKRHLWICFLDRYHRTESHFGDGREFSWKAPPCKCLAPSKKGVPIYVAEITFPDPLRISTSLSPTPSFYAYLYSGMSISP